MRNEKLRFKEIALWLIRVWVFVLLGTVIPGGLALSSTTELVSKDLSQQSQPPSLENSLPANRIQGGSDKAEIRLTSIEPANPASKAKVDAAYGKLPLYFIQNNGQMDERVKFYEKGNGRTTFFAKDGVYLSLLNNKREAGSIEHIAEERRDRPSGLSPSGPVIANEAKQSQNSELIKLTFLNANPNPEIITEGLQEGKVNYFIGNDPKKWRTNIPTHQAVIYKEVYPGIDIKFYGNNQQMEYDIVVKPGADPAKVRFAYDGIEDLRLTEEGDLEIVLHSPSSTQIPPLKKGGGGGEGRGEGNKIIQKKPVIYQEIDGERVAVDGRFVIARDEVTSVIAKPEGAKHSSSYMPSPLAGEGKGEGDSWSGYSQFTYTFELAAYDKAHPLVIDPVLIYATYLGGSGTEYGSGIAVDGSDNAYVTGYTPSTDFPTTPGAYDTTLGSSDAFVVKLNGNGSALVYATYLGGSDSEYGSGIAVDGSGNAYVTGGTSSSNFPTTSGAYDTTLGSSDAFVVKLNGNGSALVYSTFIGGSDSEHGRGIAVDGSGNAYVTGYTYSTNFPATPGAYDTTFSGGSYGAIDVFVAKLNGNGSALVYATYLGGSDSEYGSGIAVDGSGNAYVTGGTSSSNFPTTPGAYDTTLGSYDAFVVKLNGNGSALVYATYLGGSDSEYGLGIAVDGSDNAYVTGWTGSTDFPATPGAYDTTLSGPGGSYDVFVAKLNGSGTNLIYATYLGGDDPEEYGSGIAVDGSGSAYVTGSTRSTDFPTTPGAYDTTYNGSFQNASQDVFVAKLDGSGTNLIYSTYLGGSGADGSAGIAVDGSGNAYVTGSTRSTDFPTTPGAYDTTLNISFEMIDAFVAKISFLITAQLPRTGQTTCYDSAGAVIPCAGTGQDGEIQAGVPWPTPRFTDNGDGTVTDDLTGLMWTKDANLMASRDPDFDTDVVAGDGAVTWQHALEYVAKLNSEAYLGYTDWGLPNINELKSMVDAERWKPALPLDHPFINSLIIGTAHWSSTTLSNDNTFAWNVYMYAGSIGDREKSNSIYYDLVWPVRSGNAGRIQLPKTGQTISFATGDDGDFKRGIEWPQPRFTDNVNDTVTDNLTGLTWIKDAGLLGAMSWQQALDYIEGMNTGSHPNFGYTDWRVPNIIELESLIDYSRFSPILQIGHPFINVNINLYEDYWSSTSWAADTWSTRNLAMLYGQHDMITRTSYSYSSIWPVRSGPVGTGSPCVQSTYYRDADNDTYGNASVTTQACTQPSGYVSDSTDCNDGNASIHPGATEVCNGVDDNCNGQIDEGVKNTYYQDADSDTYGNASVTTQACTAPSGYVSNSSDCNDSNAAINPGAAEVCNGVDDNCNGQVDEGVQNTYYRDADSDLYGNASVSTQACTQPAGYVTNYTDCNDANASIHPGATEVCNGADDNCNGQIDEGFSLSTYYRDADSDTYGNASLTTLACIVPTGYVPDNTDCNDTSASINPAAAEICNGVDDNCNGQIDETCLSTTDLSITNLDAIDPVTPAGQDVTYTITVTNNGPSDATGVTVTDVLDASLTLVSATPSQGDPCTGAGTITCNLGGIISGSSTTVTVVATTSITPGMIGSTASVTATEPDPNASNNSAMQTTNVGDVSREVGISTRGYVDTGTNIMVGGFSFGGTVSKKVLIRGRGPSMSGAPYNFTGTLTNPTLEIYSGTTLFATVDDWQAGATMCNAPAENCGTPSELQASSVDPCQPNVGQTTSPPGCMQEAALYITLPPGAYTAKLKGVNNGVGKGIIEVYDADTASLTMLGGISTRGKVLTGTDVMVGGFIVGAGSSNKTLLLRGRGPSMSGAPYNFTGTLSNPTLEVYSGQTLFATVDDWQAGAGMCNAPAISCGTPSQLQTALVDPCQPNMGQTIAPPGCTQESAMFITLPPGAYTAKLKGVNNSTGIGIFEVYEMP